MNKVTRWGATLTLAALLTPQLAIAKEKDAQSPPEPTQDLYGIAVALLQYTVDFDNALPPMQNAEAAKKAVWPYSHNDAVFVNSRTGDKYQPNVALSKRKLSELNGKKVVLFYESKPSANGKRWVLFLPKADEKGDFNLVNNHDQYVKQVSAEEWKKLKSQLDPGS